MKKILALNFVVMILLTCVCFPSYALDKEIIDGGSDYIEEKYTYIKSAKSELNIINGKAIIQAKMQSKSGINKS